MAQPSRIGRDGRYRLALPSVDSERGGSLEQLLRARRSVREYSAKPVSLAQLARLLWAGQGVTRADGLRTAPSAGALYPLELHAIAAGIPDLTNGVYRYVPRAHTLVRTREGDVRAALAVAALDQAAVAAAPVVIAFTAVPARTRQKYGERGWRYVYLEAGHAAQNVWLQAIALRLVAVVLGAFDDSAVQQTLGLPPEEVPLYLMPIGVPRPLP